MNFTTTVCPTVTGGLAFVHVVHTSVYTCRGCGAPVSVVYVPLYVTLRTLLYARAGLLRLVTLFGSVTLRCDTIWLVTPFSLVTLPIVDVQLHRLHCTVVWDYCGFCLDVSEYCGFCK